MKEGSFISYIFTVFEILYLARCLGAEKIIDMNFEDFKLQGNIMEKAEKSLESKNYVFKDFSGELIFNRELVKYFEPVVNCRFYIACIVKNKEYSKRLGFYITDSSFVCFEKDNFNKDNYVLTYGQKIKNIEEEILREADSFLADKKSYGTISLVFKSLLDESEKPKILIFGFSDGNISSIDTYGKIKTLIREEMERAINFEITELTKEYKIP